MPCYHVTGGWKGESDSSLSALFSNTLRIGATGSSTSTQSLQVTNQVRKVDEIKQKIMSMRRTLASVAASGVADGGAKVKTWGFSWVLQVAVANVPLLMARLLGM